MGDEGSLATMSYFIICLAFSREVLQAIKNSDQTYRLQCHESQSAALVKVWSPQVQFESSVSNAGPEFLCFRRIPDPRIQAPCMVEVHLQ